jgi:hypothetical protein
MATFTQAAGVGDFGVRPRRRCAGNFHDDMRLGFPLTFKLTPDAGLEVALEAADFFVRRLLPGFNIGIHIMAHAAEFIAGSCLEQQDNQKYKYTKGYSGEDQQPLPVLTRPPRGFMKKIANKLYQ